MSKTPSKRGSAWPAAALAALALASSAPLLADRVITEDGRIVSPKKARKEGDGYRLVFEHGEIHVPDASRIQSIEIEGDMSDYVPQNADEEQKLAEGFVRFRGKWMSKSRYEAELNAEFKASKERSDMLAEHAEWHNAWTLETEHFLFKTNTSPELLEHYADLLEAYYDLMDKRVGINPTPTLRRAKMTVSIYRSHLEFYELADAPGLSVLGYFSPVAQTLNFFHDYAEPGRSDWVALHECTHLLTYLIDDQFRPQIWINEAVADYFGSAEITKDKRGRLAIAPGKLQTDRVLTVQQAITEGKDTKLEKLFFLEQPEFDGFQYAHAWSFVYFLNNYGDGMYQKGFNKFFKDLYTTAKGVPYEMVASYGKAGTGKEVKPEHIQELLLERLKVKDLAELEKQWKAFIAAIPIESREARLKRGLIAVMRGEFDQAITDLDAAIEAGTTDPRAFAARARAKAFKGGPKDGAEDMKKAIELDPLSAAYRYEYSMLLSGIVGLGSPIPGLDISVTRSGGEKYKDPEAKTQAGLATELDPENDRYREWYAEFE